MKKEILKALELSKASEEIRLCDLKEAEDLLMKIQDRFVIGDPTAWWNALKGAPQVHDYTDASGLAHLDEYLRFDDARCWLIIDEGADRFCLNMPLKAVKQFLEQLPFVEYYVVGERLDWLVCENDHNQVIVLKP